jgi:AcrR family transcriptional regulator
MIHESKPLGRRERTRLERLAEIRAAGLKILEREGLDALTIARLAKEMEWAVGALYRYFPSKEALLADLEREVIALFRASLAQSAENTERDLDGRSDGVAALVLLKRSARHYVALSRHRTEAFRLISLLMGDPRPHLSAEHGKEVMQTFVPLLRDVERLFQRAFKTGALRPGDSMRRTTLYWLSVHGVVQAGKLSRFDPELFDLDRQLEEITDALLRGWGASDALLHEANTLLRHLPSEVWA